MSAPTCPSTACQKVTDEVLCPLILTAHLPEGFHQTMCTMHHQQSIDEVRALDFVIGTHMMRMGSEAASTMVGWKQWKLTR